MSLLTFYKQGWHISIKLFLSYFQLYVHSAQKEKKLQIFKTEAPEEIAKKLTYVMKQKLPAYKILAGYSPTSD